MHRGRRRRRPFRGITSLVVLVALLGGLAPDVRGHVTSVVGAMACHAVDHDACADPVAELGLPTGHLPADLSPAQVADRLEGIVPPDQIAQAVRLAADGDQDGLTDHLAVLGGTVATRAAQVVTGLVGSVHDQEAAPCEPLPSTWLSTELDLDVHEALGGHTLQRHVGLTDDDLRHRLATTTVSAASTFPEQSSAEATIAALLRCRAAEVQAWLDGERPRLTTHARFTHVVGRTLPRHAAAPWPAHGVVVVLDRLVAAPSGYRITTAFPRIEP